MEFAALYSWEMGKTRAVLRQGVFWVAEGKLGFGEGVDGWVEVEKSSAYCIRNGCIKAILRSTWSGSSLWLRRDAKCSKRTAPSQSELQSEHASPSQGHLASFSCLSAPLCQCMGAPILAALAGLALQQAFSQMLLHLTLMTLLQNGYWRFLGLHGSTQ